MRAVHQKRLAALKRRRDFLTNRIAEGEENSHDLREHLALTWAIDVIEELGITQPNMLDTLEKLVKARLGG